MDAASDSILEDPEVCVTLDDWATPATAYPERRIGDHRIRRRRYGRGFYKMSGLDDKALFQVTGGHSLPITCLEQRRVGGGWHTWMVDDPPHWKAMQVYAAAARGAVLCAGLGLGLIQHALAANPAVDYVLTVEREAAVIELVNPLLPHPEKELRTIQADWRGVMSADLDAVNENWGMIVVDLWVTGNLREKYEAMGDAAPMAVRLRERWPTAVLVFHGFTPLSDVKWPISDKTRRVMGLLTHGDH